MNIYGSSPNRFYPYICNAVHALKTGTAQHSILCIQREEDRYYGIPTPLDCWDQGQGTLQNDGWHYSSLSDIYQCKYALSNQREPFCIEYDAVFRSKYENVCGIVSTEYIQKQSDDFCFTALIDPVDRVYEMYQFIRYIAQNKVLQQTTAEDLSLFATQIGVTGKQIFNKTSVVTLEEYIDLFIECGGQFSITGDLFFSPWCFRQTERLDGNLDYVCFLTDLKSIIKGTAYLNNRLDLNLSFNILNNYSRHIRSLCDNNTYRRNDIEKLIKGDIEVYNELKNKFI